MKINKKVSLILTLLLMLMLTSNLSAASATEKAALVALYNSTGGDNWANYSNWNTGDPCTNGWYGVYCDGDENIVELLLERNQLTGSIPPEIGNLTNVTYLSLYSNQLTGSIPGEIGNMTNLEEIYFEYNQLTGSIPANMGSLANLIVFSSHDNQLTGIPPEMGNMRNLEDLALHDNNLTGSIPAEIEGMTNLRALALYNNQLTGNIPAEIGNMANLDYIALENNQLTGNIPTEIGDLSNLETLSLSSNQLTGSIPTEIGSLAKLRNLLLKNNYLSGEIPDSIIQLTALSDIYGLKLSTNCNLFSNNTEVQDFIVLKSRDTTTYDDFLATQGNCQSETPTCTLNSIILNSTVSGSWSSDCNSINRPSSYAQYYTFTIIEEEDIRVNLASETDTYLFLLEGNGTSGVAIAENDDSNDEQNSEIISNLSAGTYTIEATTYNPSTLGDFNLSVVNMGVTAPSTTCTLNSIILNSTVSGSWSSDCNSINRPSSYAQYYTFTITGEEDAKANLTSIEDTYLFLLKSNGTSWATIAENDDSNDERNSEIISNLSAGTYMLEATTYNSSTLGDFDLSLVNKPKINPAVIMYLLN